MAATAKKVAAPRRPSAASDAAAMKKELFDLMMERAGLSKSYWNELRLRFWADNRRNDLLTSAEKKYFSPIFAW